MYRVSDQRNTEKKKKKKNFHSKNIQEAILKKV